MSCYLDPIIIIIPHKTPQRIECFFPRSLSEEPGAISRSFKSLGCEKFIAAVSLIKY
jgi:hypothetical protein